MIGAGHTDNRGGVYRYWCGYIDNIGVTYMIGAGHTDNRGGAYR